MAYFDGCSKKTASRLLAREINLTPGLLDALRPTGYRPAQKRLSPRQLQILFSYLGDPSATLRRNPRNPLIPNLLQF